MPECTSRSSLVELIVQCVREGTDPTASDWEVGLRHRLELALAGPFVDGQIITAAYLNLLESRVSALEKHLSELKFRAPASPVQDKRLIVGD